MIQTESCAHCKFFSDKHSGRCTRYPPKIIPNGTSIFPRVDHTDWCGEFRRKEHDKKERDLTESRLPDHWSIKAKWVP